MRSSRFRIMQEMNNSRSNNTDPHANHSNPTLERLAAKLAELHNNNNQAAPEAPKTDADQPVEHMKECVITDPNGNVFQLTGDHGNEVEVLMNSLLALHFTHGGNCSQPSLSISNNIHRFNATTNTTTHSTLSLQGCSNVVIPSFMLGVLGNVTKSLSSLPDQELSTRGYEALGIAMFLAVFIGSVMYLVTTHNAKEETHANESDLDLDDYDSSDEESEFRIRSTR